MFTYCLKCKKDTENVNSKVLKTRNGRTMFLLSKLCHYDKDFTIIW